jgi:hypothetical protein
VRRTILVAVPLAVLGLLAWAWSAAPPTPGVEPKLTAAPFLGFGRPGAAGALGRVVTYRGTNDPRTTLTDVLDDLGKLAEVRFSINERAFKYEMLAEPSKVPVAEGNALPRLRASVASILGKVLERVPVPSGATFLVRRDAIEITTGQFLQLEVWGNDYKGPFLPLVNARLRNQPLADALDELAEQADFSVVLDSSAAKAAEMKVTARFRNTPLDVAVGVLADGAGLRSVVVRNTLYVTTPEKAEGWAEWAEKDRPKSEDAVEAGGGVVATPSGRLLRLSSSSGAAGGM